MGGDRHDVHVHCSYYYGDTCTKMCGGWMVLVTGDRPSLGRPTRPDGSHRFHRFPRGGKIAAKKMAGNINLAKENGGKNSLAKIAVSTKCGALNPQLRMA